MLRATSIAVALACTACSGCGQQNESSGGGRIGAGGAAGGGGGGIVAQCADGWCLIPPTTFVMGSPEGEPGAAAFAENQVEVTLTRAFLLQQTELTLGLTRTLGWPDPTSGQLKDTCTSDDCPAWDLSFWEALMLANELSRRHNPPLQECYLLAGCSGTPGLDAFCTSFSMPVASVYDCEGYRLPTEAEWERAARAGTTTATYNGDIRDDDPHGCPFDRALEPIAWYCQNYGGAVHAVGQKQPNAFGLFDMIGNLQEWAHNRFDHSGYGEGPFTDPLGGDDQYEERATRGGNIWGPRTMCRAANRFPADWDVPPAGPVGVRLARTVTSQD